MNAWKIRKRGGGPPGKESLFPGPLNLNFRALRAHNDL